jgi:hypothetical protein
MLSHKEALLIANVVVETVKGFLSVSARDGGIHQNALAVS